MAGKDRKGLGRAKMAGKGRKSSEMPEKVRNTTNEQEEWEMAGKGWKGKPNRIGKGSEMAGKDGKGPGRAGNGQEGQVSTEKGRK